MPSNCSCSASCYRNCVVPDPVAPPCECECCCEAGISSKPVRYANGELQMSVSDLASGGFGQPWGHTRIYSNRLSQNQDFGNGYNWLIEQWPYIVVEQNGTVVVVWNSHRTIWFDEVGGVYIGRFSAKQALIHNGNFYQVSFPDGTVWKFHDFSQSQYPGGLFAQVTSPGGQVTQAQAYTDEDQIAEIVRTDSGVTESYLYSYGVSGAEANRLTNVLLRRGDGVTWTNIRRVLYTYHDGQDAHGSEGDLRTVVQQTWDGVAWGESGRYYYRYYKDAAGGVGFQHGLKYVLETGGYQKMLSQSLDPILASDTQLASFASYYYEYNNDTDHRISLERVDGGTREHTFTYTTSNFAHDYNHWLRQTVETLPDGSQITVFTNHIGLVLLKEHKDTTDPSRRWIECYRYDDDGHEILHAMPSAVDLSGAPYDTAFADLDVQLKANVGLIHSKTYYTQHDPITGGGSGTESGAAHGYQEYEQVQNGSAGTPVRLKRFQYTSNTVSGISVYPIAKETVYRNDNATGEIVSRYEYQWHDGTNQMLQRIAVLPAVPVSQNGAGVEDSQVEIFDAQGNLVWKKDPRGYITHHEYDVARGVMTRSIQDVDGAQLTLPSGWTTPAGGGLHLITDYQYDDQGRLTQTLGPVHEAVVDGVATQVRQARWTVYQDATRERWSAQGYATGSAPSYTYTLVNPVSIARYDDDGHLLEQIKAMRASTAGKLSPSDAFPQSSFVRWSKNAYNEHDELVGSQVYHTIPASGAGIVGVNYDESHFGYDLMERQNRHTTPSGTITRTVFDMRGRPLQTFIGTNDIGATDNDPAGGGTVGNNMMLVSEQQYDNGGIGDGNVTQMKAWVDSATSRTTTFAYDWCNRRVETDGELTHFQKSHYDNLSREIKSEQYHATDSGNLLARSETKYDDRGRPYQTIRYAVDPATGNVGNSLVDNLYYDASGHAIENRPSGSSTFTKSVYDGVGRQVASSIGYYDNGNEVLFEQSHTQYDSASNAVFMTSKQRHHNASGTGDLQGPSGSQPKSRDSYQALWYDAAGRSLASANYGTNNDAGPPTRPSVPPASSDLVLVQQTHYNDRGEAFETVDPAGMVNRTVADHAGRTIQTIQNYVASRTAADMNVTTEMQYGPGGQLTALIAKNATTGDQVTTYVYGVTLTDSDLASNDLLAAEIYPDAASATDRITYGYNRQGQRTLMQDQNGSVHEYEYDALGRQTADKVTTLAAGVDGAVRRIGHSYEARGLVERITSCSDVAGVTPVNEVQNVYNSFGQLTAQYQEHSGAVNTSTTPKVQYAYADGVANTIRPTSMTYPNGRVLQYLYDDTAADKLSRIRTLHWDGTDICRYSYLGVGTFVTTDYLEPQVKLDYALGSGANPYTGFDRFGRIIDLLWEKYGSSSSSSSSESGPGNAMVHLQYGYDQASNRTYRADLVAQNYNKDFDELYEYDGMQRLQKFHRGRLTNDNQTIVSPTFQQGWQLDANGNWRNFTQNNQADAAQALDQQRLANRVNEITQIARTVGADWATPEYDRNGNMTVIPQPKEMTQTFQGKWDAWNRMVTLEEPNGSGGWQTLAEYQYGGQTWRTVSKSYASGILDETRHFYFTSQWQGIEERLGSTDANQQFVRGLRYIDDLVLRDRDTGGGTLGERLYAIQDANWNVVAISFATGSVSERYVYFAYGLPNVLNDAFSSLLEGGFDWTVLYASYYLEPTSNMFAVRHRWLHSELGTWTSRDPMFSSLGVPSILGVVLGKPLTSFDLLNYAGNNPIVRTDAYGLDWKNPLTWFSCWQSAKATYKCGSFMSKYTALSEECEKEDLFTWGLKCEKQISPLLNVNSAGHANLCCVLHKAKDDPEIDMDDFTAGFQNCLKSLKLSVDFLNLVFPNPLK